MEWARNVPPWYDAMLRLRGETLPENLLLPQFRCAWVSRLPPAETDLDPLIAAMTEDRWGGLVILAVPERDLHRLRGVWSGHRWWSADWARHRRSLFLFGSGEYRRVLDANPTFTWRWEIRIGVLETHTADGLLMIGTPHAPTPGWLTVSGIACRHIDGVQMDGPPRDLRWDPPVVRVEHLIEYMRTTTPMPEEK